MADAIINIGGQFHAATGSGIIAVADEIQDESMNKRQSQVNKMVKKAIKLAKAGL